MSSTYSRTAQFQVTLGRIASANTSPSKGPGITAGDFIPLAHYRSRKVARQLQNRLRNSGIRTKSHCSRTRLTILVAVEDRQDAFRVLGDFQQQHPDTKPQRFTRDYELLVLGSVASCVMAAMAWYLPTATPWVSLLVLVSGISISIFAERIRRKCRHYDGFQISISDLLLLVVVCSVNLALWRYLAWA